MNKQKKENITRIAIYCGVIFIAGVLQNIPGFFQISVGKPNLILAVVVAIAMFEQELIGGVLGAFGGLLWDCTSRLLFGTGGIFFMLFSAVSALLCMYWLRQSQRNCCILVAISGFFFAFICYYFGYGLWGYDNASTMLLHEVFPTTCLTTLSAPIAFKLVEKIREKYATHED